MVDLRSIKALTFDVGGTVFDWHSSIADALDRIATDRGANIDRTQFAECFRRPSTADHRTEYHENTADARCGQKTHHAGADSCSKNVGCVVGS